MGASRQRIQPVRVVVGNRRWRLRDLDAPLDLEALVPGSGDWEVELGFGKGRYLLERALAEPGRRFLGIEMAGKYFRILARRAVRQNVANLLLIRGEALYLLAALLPRRFAAVVHVYFPDPWPKDRHHKRRLFDVESVDLVLDLLSPGGSLYFATDHLEYADVVADILGTHPSVDLRTLPGGWPDGARTNYEAKYMAHGRPIRRLEVRVRRDAARLHPAGRAGVLVASGERTTAS